MGPRRQGATAKGRITLPLRIATLGAAAVVSGIVAQLRARLAGRPEGSDHRSASYDFEQVSEAMAEGDLAFLSDFAAATPGFPNDLHVQLGQPYFHLGVELGQPDVVAWLLGTGADLGMFEARGYSPLIPATLREDEDGLAILRLLLEAGCDPNCRGMTGETPLHLAVETENAAAVELLCDFGADETMFDYSAPPVRPCDSEFWQRHFSSRDNTVPPADHSPSN